METYINKVTNYIERALEEPSKDEGYIKGLQHSLMLGERGLGKKGLVIGVLRLALIELDTSEPDYSYIRGLVASMKEALKLDGELDLAKFTVETPVHKMVKDANNKVTPLKYVEGEYDEFWTMPEILVYDVTFVGFAKEV